MFSFKKQEPCPINPNPTAVVIDIGLTR